MGSHALARAAVPAKLWTHHVSPATWWGESSQGHAGHSTSGTARRGNLTVVYKYHGHRGTQMGYFS